MAKNPDGSPDGSEERKGGGSRKTLYFIIAIVVIVAIVFAVSKLKSTPSEAATPTLTLASLNTSLTSVDSRLTTAEGTIASHTESLANLRTDVNKLISPTDWSGQINALKSRLDAEETKSANFTASLASFQIVLNNVTVSLNTTFNSGGNTTANYTKLTNDITTLQGTLNSLHNEIDALPNWSADILALKGNLTALQSEIDSWSFSLPRYAYVSNVGADYLIANLFGAGAYPVVFTIYGNALQTDDVNIYPPIPGYNITACTIYARYLDSSNSTLTVIVEPDTSWPAEDVIMLQILKGDIDYATANVAEKR